MPKTGDLVLERDQSRERLIAAVNDRKAAISDLQQAEDARLAARDDHLRAQSAILEIEERIKKIGETRTYAWQQRAEAQDKIAAEQDLLPDAKSRLRPSAAAEASAKARVTDAELRVAATTDKLCAAADAVIREGAGPTANALMKRIADAMNILVADGPLLESLLRTGMLSGSTADAAKATVSAFYTNVGAWAQYEQRRQHNEWTAAREALRADPTAPLPVAG